MIDLRIYCTALNIEPTDDRPVTVSTSGERPACALGTLRLACGGSAEGVGLALSVALALLSAPNSMFVACVGLVALALSAKCALLGLCSSQLFHVFIGECYTRTY